MLRIFANIFGGKIIFIFLNIKVFDSLLFRCEPKKSLFPNLPNIYRKYFIFSPPQYYYFLLIFKSVFLPWPDFTTLYNNLFMFKRNGNIKTESWQMQRYMVYPSIGFYLIAFRRIAHWGKDDSIPECFRYTIIVGVWIKIVSLQCTLNAKKIYCENNGCCVWSIIKNVFLSHHFYSPMIFHIVMVLKIVSHQQFMMPHTT